MKNKNKSFSSIKYEYIIGLLGSETKFDLLSLSLFFLNGKVEEKVSGKLVNFQQLCSSTGTKCKKKTCKAHFVF